MQHPCLRLPRSHHTTPRPTLPLYLPACSSQRFAFKHNLYRLREERDIKPSAFGHLVSATLYERRFGPYFCQPVIGMCAYAGARGTCAHLPTWLSGMLPAIHACYPLLYAPHAAGLEPDGTPYLCGMDSIGAQETAKDFLVAGTATDSLLGICESLWRPDLVRR